MPRHFILPFFVVPIIFACNAGGHPAEKGDDEAGTKRMQQNEDLEEAYFASGCFWCVEHVYERVEGVEEAISGFAGGKKKDPSYRQVASGATRHAETVKVLYDPDVVSFRTLVKVYYASQNPTTNGQPPDMGPQYRSIILFENEEEKRIAQEAKDSVASSGAYDDPIVTEIKELKRFYKASKKHQDYVEKNPDAGYVRQVSVPRYERFKDEMPAVLK